MKRLYTFIVITIVFPSLVHQSLVNGQTSEGQAKPEIGLTNDLMTESNTGLQFRKVCGITGSRSDASRHRWGKKHP